MEWSDNAQREQIKFQLDQIKSRFNIIIILLALITIFLGILAF